MFDAPISISEFNYDLDEKRIALHPVSPRDSSKLLVYNQGQISDSVFHELPEILPEKTALFFNDTRVINARILFQRESGATIEVFLLDPVFPKETSQAMSATQSCVWKCMVGNLKKWKEESLRKVIQGDHEFELKARIVSRDRMEVEFSWTSSFSFGEVIQIVGVIPLPPYLNRKAIPADRKDYQTIYSKVEGAVAAPTAGLHFTENVFSGLNSKNIKCNFLTLHVGAGTFKPVEVENIKEHPIHHEQIILKRENIKALLDSENTIAVGTTSMRTIESIYWLGVQLKNSKSEMFVHKKSAYSLKPLPTESALEEVLTLFDKSSVEEIPIKTELFIHPGYKFQICKGLITNFHLPKSSLLMLVSAFIGSDWKKLYQHALKENYRFLSFGDSSLLLPIQ